MAENPSQKHSRFQFSLRTLLIGVTLFGFGCSAGTYVAHEAQIVRERKAWIDSHASPGNFHTILFHGDPKHSPSRVRVWLGDEAHGEIVLPQSASNLVRLEMEVQAAADLFPEADIAIEWR